MMNRQSRRKGYPNWTNRGPVSIKDAAIAEATLYTSDEVDIEVRDADSPVIHSLRVKQFTQYRVSGLRGDADKEPAAA